MPSRLLKNFPAQVAAIRAALPRCTPIELWWQDEARVGQKNGITRRWAKRVQVNTTGVGFNAAAPIAKCTLSAAFVSDGTTTNAIRTCLINYGLAQ